MEGLTWERMSTARHSPRNRLRSGRAGGTPIYDGFGNRVSKTANGVTTKYLVEDDVNPTGYPQVFDELTGSTVTRTYTYGLQRISENQVIDNVWTRTTQVEDADGLTDDKLRIAGMRRGNPSRPSGPTPRVLPGSDLQDGQ